MQANSYTIHRSRLLFRLTYLSTTNCGLANICSNKIENIYCTSRTIIKSDREPSGRSQTSEAVTMHIQQSLTSSLIFRSIMDDILPIVPTDSEPISYTAGIMYSCQTNEFLTNLDQMKQRDWVVNTPTSLQIFEDHHVFYFTNRGCFYRNELTMTITE